MAARDFRCQSVFFTFHSFFKKLNRDWRGVEEGWGDDVGAFKFGMEQRCFMKSNRSWRVNWKDVLRRSSAMRCFCFLLLRAQNPPKSSIKGCGNEVLQCCVRKKERRKRLQRAVSKKNSWSAARALRAHRPNKASIPRSAVSQSTSLAPNFRFGNCPPEPIIHFGAKHTSRSQAYISEPRQHPGTDKWLRVENSTVPYSIINISKKTSKNIISKIQNI